MKIYFDMKEIQHILSIMHKISGATITCFDRTLRCISFLGIEGTLCLQLKSSPHFKLRHACYCSDAANAAFALRHGLCYMYTCPAGISEIVMPVCNGQTVLAYFMLGKFITRSQQQEVRRQVCRLSEQYEELNTEHILHSLNEFPVLDDKKITEIIFVLQSLGILSGECGIIRAEEDEPAVPAPHAFGTAVENPDAARIEERAEVEKIAAYIMQNLGKNLPLCKLCKTFPYSKSSMNRLFKKVYGQTVHGFCDRKRLERAKRLLAEQGLNMSEIAERLGFDNASYFSQWFKKRTGTSPLKYRKRMRALLLPPRNELPTD